MRMARETPSGMRYTTDEVWQFERWNYGPCREQLKLLTAFCEQFRIFVVGLELLEEVINQLVGETQLPVSLLDRLDAMSWHPDEYVSFQFELSNERGEWLGVAEQYRKFSPPRLATEAGAAELPGQLLRKMAQD